MSGSVTYAAMSSSVVVSNATAATSTVPTTSATGPNRATWTPTLLPDGRPDFPYDPPFTPGEAFWNATSDTYYDPRTENSTRWNETVGTAIQSVARVCKATVGQGSATADPGKTETCCKRAGGLFATNYGCRLSAKSMDDRVMMLAFQTCTQHATGGHDVLCEHFDATFVRGFGDIEAATAWGNYNDQASNATDGTGTVLCTAFGGTEESTTHCCMDPERAAKDAAAAPELRVPCAVKNNNESLTLFARCVRKQDAFPVCLPRDLPINARAVREAPPVDSAAGPAADAKRGALAAAVVATLALASFVTM